MGLFWEVVPVAYKVAEILWIFAQHVAYLTTSICSVLSSLDPSIGCLLQKKIECNSHKLTNANLEMIKCKCSSQDTRKKMAPPHVRRNGAIVLLEAVLICQVPSL